MECRNRARPKRLGAELRDALGLPSVVESPATAGFDDAPDDAGQTMAVAR
jgi:hypothetical protein